MRRLFTLLALPLALLLAQCTTPSMENRLSKMEAKQDSILKVLGSMQEKHEFMATRMGWRPPRPPADTAPKVIPLGTSQATGPENALLTVVEFTDLQCPYCSQIAPVLDTLARKHPQEVRVVFKHFPLSFHPMAKPAAAAAIAAGKQGKFFAFRYKVAPHFRTLKDSLYMAVAKEIGLNLEQFQKDMAISPEVERIISEDMDLGRKLGVEGTPTIYVNGKLAEDRSMEYFEGLLLKAKGG